MERDEGPATAASFRQLTGSDAEFAGWQRFYGRLATLAEDLAPTLTEPLLDAGTDSPAGCATRSCGTTCASARWPTWSPTTSRDDVVRGVALTDGLIGTFADVHAADGPAGRCFLYHLIGNGTGQLAGAGGRHGRGERCDGGRRPRGAGAELVTAGHGHGPGRPGGRRHRALDRRRRRERGGRRRPRGLRRRAAVLDELTGADPRTAARRARS